MQNNSNGVYTFEKNVYGSDRHPNRMYTIGYGNPKDFYNAPFQHNFEPIFEAKHLNLVPSHMNSFHTMNGDYEKKSEMSNQNFFSENNVNLSYRNQHKTLNANALDSRCNYVDANNIPRFSSTPIIAQTSVGHHIHNETHFSDVPLYYNPSLTTPSTYNGHINSNHSDNPSDNSYTYMHSPYVHYYLRTNPYQNVILNPSTVPSINSNIDTSDRNMAYYNNCGNLSDTNDYHVDLESQEPSDLNDNYLNCQLNMVQENLETNMYSKYVQDDLMFFLPPELPNDITDINRAESQSMPSLHGDDSVDTDFDSSDDDQLNTVHGEEMLHELQKLSKVFTNVINLPMPRNNTTIVSPNFPCHSNFSRFKKTRIKERTTVWHMEGFFVRDKMVKIIPDEVVNIRRMDIEHLEMLEIDILGCKMPKKSEIETVATSPYECIHSSYQCRPASVDLRYLTHSTRSNSKYRSCFSSHSPTDVNNPLKQNLPSNISSRYLHRKSLQIPVRIPIVWNPIIPMRSPVVQHCSQKMFFEPTNLCNGTKSSRRKRRWSVSGTKLEKNNYGYSLRSHNNQRQPCDLPNHVKYDLAHEYFDNRHSFDSRDLEETYLDGISQTCANLESKLDNHLVSLKRTVMSYVECNLSEIRDEVRSLRGTHVSLEKQLKYYKEKVHILEESVRQNLPQDQWQLYGILISSDNTNSTNSCHR